MANEGQKRPKKSKPPDRRPCKLRYNMLNQCARNKVRRYRRMLREQPNNADIPPALVKAEAQASFPYVGKGHKVVLPATPKAPKVPKYHRG